MCEACHLLIALIIGIACFIAGYLWHRYDVRF